jgi:predicted methyltransferase
MPCQRLPLLCSCLFALGLLAACAPEASTPDPAAEEPPAASPPSGIDPAILDHAARSKDDHYRDSGFRPLKVYEFFGIEPGMHVADMMPGGGYNTVLLSQIVGEAGKVTALLSARPGDDPERGQRTHDRLTERVDPFGLDNLEVVADPSTMPDDSVDVLLTVRNYHDLGSAEDRMGVLPELMRILRPGGIFAVVDAYTAKADERDETVHRINDELTKAEITASGFEFVEASDILVNPDDTYDFDGRERAGRRGATEDAPIHRYYVYRFVHKYRKPMQ